MVAPSHVVHKVSVCDSGQSLLLDDIIPLDWNQGFQQDQEENTSIVTHNTRRKLHEVING